MHNTNLHTTLYYCQIFENSSSGSINVYSEVSGIFPEMFENWSFEIKVVISIGIIYLLGLIYQIYNVFQDLYAKCRKLWTSLKFEISLNLCMDFCVVLLSLAAISLFIKIVFADVGKFKLPITDEDKFSDLIDYATDYKIFLRVISYTVFLTCFKIFMAFESKFPSFGVLFDTINAAKSYIINFAFITCLIFVLVSLFGHVAFGINMVDFSSLSASLISIIDLTFGKFGYQNLGNVNKNTA